MSDSETPTETYIAPIPLRRRSRASRWLMLLGAVASGGLLSCCLGWLVLALVFGPSQTQVPAEVTAIAQRIAPVELPPDFQPAWGWEADHSVAWVQVARFDHNAGRGLLLIGELHLRVLANEQEHVQLRSMLTDSMPDLRLVTPQTTEERKRTIRRREATFEIIEGEDRASTTRLRQVTGSFLGHEGTAILILQAEADFLSNEAIDALLDSLAKPMSGKAAVEK